MFTMFTSKKIAIMIILVMLVISNNFVVIFSLDMPADKIAQEVAAQEVVNQNDIIAPEDTPEIDVNDDFAVTIEEIAINKFDKLMLSANIEIMNSDQNDFSNWKCITEVYEELGDKTNLVNIQSVDFSINKLQKKTLNIVHKFPDILKNGDYSLTVRIKNVAGDEIGMMTQFLGENSAETTNAITFDTNESYFVKDNKNIALYDVRPFNIEEKPVMFISAENTSTSALSGKVYLRLFDSDEGDGAKPLSEKVLSVYSFKALESKKIRIDLPAQNETKNYLLEISLRDNNNLIVSDLLKTPIVVMKKGFALSQITGKQSGKEGNFTVTAGFLSEITEEDSLKMEMIVKNVGDQKEVYKRSVMLNNKGINEEVTFKIPLMNVLGDISVEAILYYNDNNVSKANKMFNVMNNNDVYTLKTLNTQNIQDTPNTPNTTNAPITLNTTKDGIKIQFSDVVGTNFEESVDKLVSQKIISGYEDNTFRPLNKITRAECMTVICHLLGVSDLAAQNKEKPVFPDVSETHWARGFINVGYNLNIIKGFPDMTFKPQDNMKYSEVLTVCVKMINKGVNAEKSQLPWPDNYVEEAKSLGITTGVDFVPTDISIRGNNAIFFARVMDSLKSDVEPRI